jgi:predicted lipoprotein with Yx(FWY)xxD motif
MKMKTQKLRNALIAALAVVGLITASCKKSSTDQAPATPAAVTGFQLTQNAKFGNILTDNNGKSLYFFSDDAAAAATCTGGCAVVWPAFYTANPSIGTGLAASDFSVTTRADGSKQNTYKGWPLYYYQNDAKAGDTNGDAIDKTWFIAKADYTVMLSSAQLVGLDGANYNDQSLAGTGISSYIVDPAGRTLYIFTKDTHNTNTFTKPDFSNDNVWPLDFVATVGSIPSTLDKTQFTIITTFGKTQLAYKGHPLYFFGQDNSVRGSTKGVSFPTPGLAVWKVNNSSTTAL